MFLVVAFGAYQDACIVKVTVFGEDDLPFNFGGIVHHGEDAGVKAHGEVAASFDKSETDAEVFVGGVEFFHE